MMGPEHDQFKHQQGGNLKIKSWVASLPAQVADAQGIAPETNGERATKGAEGLCHFLRDNLSASRQPDLGVSDNFWASQATSAKVSCQAPSRAASLGWSFNCCFCPDSNLKQRLDAEQTACPSYMEFPDSQA